MRLSPATRLADSQTVWVAYSNDGTMILKGHAGHPAAVWFSHFADAFRDDVRTIQWD